MIVISTRSREMQRRSMYATQKHPLFYIHIVTLAFWALPLSSSSGPTRAASLRPSVTHGSQPMPWGGSCRTTPRWAIHGQPHRGDVLLDMACRRQPDLGPANTNEILARHPDAINDYNHPAWKELGPSAVPLE